MCVCLRNAAVSCRCLYSRPTISVNHRQHSATLHTKTLETTQGLTHSVERPKQIADVIWKNYVPCLYAGIHYITNSFCKKKMLEIGTPYPRLWIAFLVKCSCCYEYILFHNYGRVDRQNYTPNCVCTYSVFVLYIECHIARRQIQFCGIARTTGLP